MRIPASEQHQLLELQEIDQSLARLHNQSSHLASEEEVRLLERRLRSVHLEAVRHRTEATDMGRQARRIDDDLQRVRARQARNQELADSGADVRLQQDLQHEAESLDRRRSELEDAEISFLEMEEEENEHAARLAEEEADLSQQLEHAQETARLERAGLDREILELQAARKTMTEVLSQPLLDLYEEARARRGVGVAVLEGNQCSACRLELTQTELARLRELGSDEVETCEECGCLLLRD